MLAAIAERIDARIAVDRTHDIPDDTREAPTDAEAAESADAEAADAATPAQASPAEAGGTDR